MPVINPVTIPLATTEGLSRAVKINDSAAILPGEVASILAAVIAGEKEGPLTGIYNSYLRLFRGNPEALLEIFQKGQEIFSQQASNRLLSGTAKNALGNLTKIIDTLVGSPKSLANPLFLKDYAAGLGLRLEGDWLDFLQRGSENQPPAESLKSVLLKLSGELTALLKDSSLGPEALPKLTQLAKFTESALRAIETQQMINVYSQENDNRYLLQVPLLFPEGVRTGEIFIDPGMDGQARGGKSKKCHVVMFLSMDKLGDMAVDASLSDNNISCVFKFTNPEAQEFFAPFLEGLGENLRRIGYGSTSLTSMVTEDLTVARQDCHGEMFWEQDAINLFA